MLLTIDVGNTNIKCGLWDNEKIIANWRIGTRKEISGDELGLVLDGFLKLYNFHFNDVEDVIVASVVPPLRPAIEKVTSRHMGKAPIFVEGHSQKFMSVNYTNPREVGADRVVVSIAAYHRFKTSLIVVDFGTATTFDCISKTGEYMGGAIAPGFKLSSEALFHKASRLPKMEQFYKPTKAIARDTINSLNSGLVLGYVGLVEGLVGRISNEMGDNPMVLATGGLAGLIAAETGVIKEVLPDLAMEGLKIIYDRKMW
jgi:type III pantothenate kinase